LEVKTVAGVVSEAQHDMHQALRGRGFVVEVVRSVAEAMEVIQ
jgi:hypothetical protein